MNCKMGALGRPLHRAFWDVRASSSVSAFCLSPYLVSQTQSVGMVIPVKWKGIGWRRKKTSGNIWCWWCYPNPNMSVFNMEHILVLSLIFWGMVECCQGATPIQSLHWWFLGFRGQLLKSLFPEDWEDYCQGLWLPAHSVCPWSWDCTLLWLEY